MKNNRTPSFLAIIIVSAFLTACGGGSDTPTDPQTPVDPQPSAKIVDNCVAKEQFLNCFTVLNSNNAPIDQVTSCKAASEGKPMREASTVRPECRG